MGATPLAAIDLEPELEALVGYRNRNVDAQDDDGDLLVLAALRDLDDIEEASCPR